MERGEVGVVVGVGVLRGAGRLVVARAQLESVEVGGDGRGARQVFIAGIDRVAGVGREARALLAGECRLYAGLVDRIVAVHGEFAGAVAAVVEHHVGAGRAAGTRDQVDDSADGVGAVDRRARTLDDLDAVEQLRRDVHQRRQCLRSRIDAHAVDHHDRLIAVGAADEHRQGLTRTAAAVDVDSGMKAQYVTHVDGEGILECRPVDHDHRFQRLIGGLRNTCGGDDRLAQRSAAVIVSCSLGVDHGNQTGDENRRTVGDHCW